MNKNKLWLGITSIVVALVLVVGIAGFTKAQTSEESLDSIISGYIQLKLSQVQDMGQSFGAAGKLLIEDYLPVIRYNEGLKTNYPIETASDSTVSGNLTVSGNTSLTGTSTISNSYDGFTAYKSLSIATTSTQTIYSNTSGVDAICDGGSFALDADATTFAPSLQFVLGTSTSATYSANLIGSSTMATTSDSILLATYNKPFKVATGEYVTARLGDITNLNASSTYYGNWTMEASLSCTLLGQ